MATDEMAPSSAEPRSDAEYIPAHLRHYVFHSREDFYVSRYFDPLLLAHLMYEGFLPIASEYNDECFLLPKLHRQRCIRLLDAVEHVPKSVKKRGKKYKLRLNQDFDAIVNGCHEQHGIPWLYPPIVKGFRALFEANQEGIEIYPGRVVRFFSVELLDVETNKVVAGELGYTTGKVYTSLTGFSGMNGAGTVQLHALGRLLYLSGMQMWDLGMSMPYKLSLGADDVDRDIFLKHLYKWRTHDCLMDMQPGEGSLAQGVHVKALFEISRPPRSVIADRARREAEASSDEDYQNSSGDDNAQDNDDDKEEEEATVQSTD